MSPIMSPCRPLPSPPSIGPGARTVTVSSVGRLSMPVSCEPLSELGRRWARLTVKTCAMARAYGPTQVPAQSISPIWLPSVVNPVAGSESPRRLRVVEFRVRPLGHDAPGRRAVVAVAVCPDRPLEIRVDLLVEAMLSFGTHIHEATASRQPAHGTGDEARTCLQDVDDRIRTLVRVRAVQHQEVRKPA